MTKLLGPDFINLQVRNLSASRTFYTQVLGLTEDTSFSAPGVVLFESTTIPFALSEAKVNLDEAPQPGWGVALFTGQDFPLRPDGTLRCPAGSTLTRKSRRQEADGSLRLVDAASSGRCRPCELREQCQWNGDATKKPRQVSILLHPLAVGPAPLRLSGLEPQRAPAGVYPTGTGSTCGD
jgi:hypothetical protein